jgi:hypothetical protein
LLISEATYNLLLNTPGRPDPATQNLLLTGQPYYEYGESIYAVVYDIGPDGPFIDTNDDGLLTAAGDTLPDGSPARLKRGFRQR